MVTKRRPEKKIIYTRIDRQLWAEVKKSAELEGMSIQDWLAKVLLRAIHPKSFPNPKNFQT